MCEGYFICIGCYFKGLILSTIECWGKYLSNLVIFTHIHSHAHTIDFEKIFSKFLSLTGAHTLSHSVGLLQMRNLGGEAWQIKSLSI